MSKTYTLTAMPYAQARVIHMDNGYIALRSYKTVVATISENGWLVINGLYSATTRKHIGAFVKEYAKISYQAARDFFEKNISYNIYTGEVTPLL